LDIDEYKYGIRSMEAVISMCQLSGENEFSKSSLPPIDLLDFHLNNKGINFLDIVKRFSLREYDIERIIEQINTEITRNFLVSLPEDTILKFQKFIKEHYSTVIEIIDKDIIDKKHYRLLNVNVSINDFQDIFDNSEIKLKELQFWKKINLFDPNVNIQLNIKDFFSKSLFTGFESINLYLEKLTFRKSLIDQLSSLLNSEIKNKWFTEILTNGVLERIINRNFNNIIEIIDEDLIVNGKYKLLQGDLTNNEFQELILEPKIKKSNDKMWRELWSQFPSIKPETFNQDEEFVLLMKKCFSLVHHYLELVKLDNQ
jgi:hypothetical protein